ncbi:RNA methyltransferase [Paenibacillus antri]|uniref:RNA methyltransferase n=1 Tax=Paenibacillus antri TaxID=2582848 RepID=A0A5R9GCS2_9BACL|nr:RNA methyltransferase [Paenibacillus antri]TLS52899.1 RNA methyltransferase [Paenibacillus antri]
MYIYAFAVHEDERDVFEMERRALFGTVAAAGASAFAAARAVDPSRSPFLKSRIDARFEADTPEALAERIREAGTSAASFKTVYVKTGEDDASYADRRGIERVVGAAVRGTADMRTPAERFGVASLGGRWRFGPLLENDGSWMKHAEKPRNYSTALSARLARSVVNLAAPEPAGVRAIDPCCGIGTVLLEALSMGVDIVGSDVNPLAVIGARENLANFGYPDVVRVADARSLEGAYDVAVVDLPYNLCSVLPERELGELLAAVRRLAPRAVLLATTPIDAAVRRAGFDVRDRCEARKGSFRREIVAVEGGRRR